jgi:hypothetical protein
MSSRVEHHAHDTPSAEPQPAELVALMGEFKDVDSVFSAAEKVRHAGFRRWDVHTPFPIHGIDAVMGTRPTVLPWLVLAAGGIALQWYCNAYDYAFPISGKPFWSLPANIPVAFECTILCAVLMSVFGMLGLCRLPTHYNPLLKSERFRRVTNDRFFVVLDATDPVFEEQSAEQLLRNAGAKYVERVED